MKNSDFYKPNGDRNYRVSQLPDFVPASEKRKYNSTSLMLSKDFIQDAGGDHRYSTENQDNFPWKVTSNTSIAKKPMDNGINNYIKPFDEKYNRHNLFKPNLLSSSQKNIQCSPEEEGYKHPSNLKKIDQPDDTMKTSIEPFKPSFRNLLNPSATTSVLTYREYSPKELSSTSKDIITFWNWKNNLEKKHTPKNPVPQNTIAPDKELRTKPKFVPNTGLISESKSSYRPKLNFDYYDSSRIKNELTDCVDVPHDWKSENAMYGSGKRIQNFIK